MEEFVECEKCNGTGKYLNHKCVALKALECIAYGGCLKNKNIKCVFYKFNITHEPCHCCNGAGKVSWIDNLFLDS